MPTANKIEVNISGDNYGNIIIGDNNIVGTPHGIKINKVKTQSNFERRTKPVNFRPRAFAGLLGRVKELQNIQNAIANNLPITLFGENGIGKTSLIRQASHLAENKKFDDGVIYLYARGEERDDLLQQVFDSIYVSTQNHKPTEAQIRNDLKNIHALIFLDDVLLKREDVAYLLDAMPKSLFVLASEQRLLWGEGQVIGLDGLPETEALQLFERELGRTLTEDEKPIAIQLCKILLHHPLRILQSASLVREEGLSIQQAFTSLTKTQTQSAPLEVTLQKSNETQKKILSLLAVAGGYALTREHLAKLAGAKTFDVDINSLVTKGLVNTSGASFSLSGESVASLVKMWDLSGWEDALINHFSNWLQTAPQDMLVDQVADTLFHLIQRAGEKKQWNHVVTIGKRLEQLYALKKKWEGWLKILKLIQLAAKYLKDQLLEGWATHQLGSRALCLGLKTEANELLNSALKIRKTIGDKEGLQVTQHNLNILLNVPVAKTSQAPSSTAKPMSVFARIILIGGVAGTLFLMFVAGLFLIPFVFTPSEIDTPIPPSTFTSVPPTATKRIITTTPTKRPTRTATPAPILLYDFIRSAQDATWEQRYSNDGVEEIRQIEFFTTPYVYSKELYTREFKVAFAGWQDNILIENFDTIKRGVSVFPYNGIYSYGKVIGDYDLSFMTIQRGDIIRTQAGFEGDLPYEISEPPSDGVVFLVIFYETNIENGVVLDEWFEYDDGQTYSVDISLDKVAGKSGHIALVVDSLGNTTADFAIWIEAKLWGIPR